MVEVGRAAVNAKRGYDDAFRITGVTDTGTPANSYTYAYDTLDRLTSAVKTGTTRGWTYDANGNRLTETGASPSTYTISSTNNRISSITGSLARTYTYSTVGSALTYSNITATYNNHGRLKTLKKASTTATYVYNAVDQLVKQSGGPSGTVLYVYDEAGHLIGEYNSTGALIEETIWLGDTPVATLRPGTPIGIFYVHTDHLNTPRRITQPSGNQLRWTWEADPFGTATPNENPASLGTFKYNLRFPGQIYDSHGGLMQNYFRDYDPATGRYVESDPVGLTGGTNTYGYGFASPLARTDPLGLFSPGAHDYILLETFEYVLSQADIARLQRSSKEFDAQHQWPSESFMHSMAEEGEALADAIRRRNEFINRTLDEARCLAEAGDRNGALDLLGQAAHPIMDWSSPMHTNPDGTPRVWRWYWPVGHSLNDSVGNETVRDVTPEMLRRQALMLNYAYQRVFGR